jgi:hypothetical protein
MTGLEDAGSSPPTAEIARAVEFGRLPATRQADGRHTVRMTDLHAWMATTATNPEAPTG